MGQGACLLKRTRQRPKTVEPLHSKAEWSMHRFCHAPARFWLRLGETPHSKSAQWRPVKKRTAIGVGELLAGLLFRRLKVAYGRCLSRISLQRPCQLFGIEFIFPAGDHDGCNGIADEVC